MCIKVRQGALETMNGEKIRDWQVDILPGKVTHFSGLTIEFYGTPESDYFEGTPKNIPFDMDSLKVVRLIRMGFDIYRDAFASEFNIKIAIKMSTL